MILGSTQGEHNTVPDADVTSSPSIDWCNRFPKLCGLFSNHLSQSWTSFHERATDALAEGIDDRTVDDLRATLGELEILLALGLTDEEMDDVLYYGLGSSYQVSGQTHAEWLGEVARQVEEAVAARAAEGG
jgi:hypothetical protein